MSYLEISLNSSNAKFYSSSAGAPEITPSSPNSMFDEFGGTVTTINTGDAYDFYLIYTFDHPQYLAKIEFDFLTGNSSPTNRLFAVSEGTFGSSYVHVDAQLGTGTAAGNELFYQTPENIFNPYGGLVKSFRLHLQYPGSDNVIKIATFKAYALEDLSEFKRKSFLKINDSEFEREGWKNARYRGSKLTAAEINKFNQGDISFANQPVIEQYSKTVYVFNQAQNSFETNEGVFYPEIDEFSQSLDNQVIVGSTQFTLNRAVTFEIGNPSNFSQIDAGMSENDDNYTHFDRLVKNDLALFNSCSVRFFNPTNNGFTKPFYTVGYNTGKFVPAAAYFTSESTQPTLSTIAGYALASSPFGLVIPKLNEGGRLYINPNVEEDFISISGSTDLPDNVPNDLASGSQGSIDATNNTAITINHSGSIKNINSSLGYFYNLSKKISPSNQYFISFNKGLQGVGINTEKHTLKAFDVREIQHSGSNINGSHDDFSFRIKTIGKNNGTFTNDYGVLSNAPIKETEFVLFKKISANNAIHLDLNLPIEAPVGVGNGGVIIPENLHPKIKESLNVYLSNAGLGAQGGSLTNFGLGSQVTAVERRQVPTDNITTSPSNPLGPGSIYGGSGEIFSPTIKPDEEDIDVFDSIDPTTLPGYGLPSPGNPHTPGGGEPENPPQQTPKPDVF